MQKQKKARKHTAGSKPSYDRLDLKLKKGSKEKLRKYVRKKNMTFSGYIKGLIVKDSGIDI